MTTREDFISALNALPASATHTNIWPLLYDYLLSTTQDDIANALLKVHNLTGMFTTSTLTVDQVARATMPKVNTQNIPDKSKRR